VILTGLLLFRAMMPVSATIRRCMMRRHLTLLGSLATIGMAGLLALPAVAQQTPPGSSSLTPTPPSATGTLPPEPRATTSQGMRRRHSATMHGGRTSQDNMADQLNAQSLQRAQSGQNLPTPGPDSTSNLNRMSDQDARSGRAMPQQPMPFR
jgi:hypothetical protein